MVHYLFLPWNLPWIILACYGNQQQQQQQQKKKKKNQLYPDQTPLYATSDQDVHGLGINLSNLGPTNRVEQNKKEEEENGCVQAVHSFITLSKATFDLWTRRLHLDVLQSQCIHTCHTNGLIIRLPLLMIRVNRLFTAQRSVKCWFFDNVWIMT